MDEATTRCNTCGTPILQRTADRHAGRCVRCHRRIPLPPPPYDFSMPSEIVARLNELDLNPADFRQMAWHSGTEAVHRHIDGREQERALFREWFPRLVDYAQQCRLTNPAPVEDGTLRAREKRRIYQAMFKNSAVAASKFAICVMPLLAMPVANDVWGQSKRIVLLTPDENAAWDKIFSQPDELLPWYTYFEWKVDDAPEQVWLTDRASGEVHRHWEDSEVPPGEEPWLVSRSMLMGPFAGGGSRELWLWDGREARFVRTAGNWIS